MHKAAILLLMFSLGAAAAGTVNVIRAFGLGAQRGGNDLYGGLILDAAGNLYGAAEAGGATGHGVVFKLAPKGAGGWTETVLYNFKGGTQDGASPHATLFRDRAGNLYGTTVGGGLGSGTVFKLTLAAGHWQESVLHLFTGGADGSVPYAGVTMDAAGNLYGATISGGASGRGVVYMLTPASGTWPQTVLHSFAARPDGAAPYTTPILDTAGNLYGATNAGGASNKGTVYELTHASGAWTERVLHNFAGGADGANPLTTNLIFDGSGNLYGVTSGGGPAGYGIAFQLSPTPAGAWSETILHAFAGIPVQDAGYPSGMIFDARGNLWGASQGGGVNNSGTIFELTPGAGGSWQETVLYSFINVANGFYPSAALVMDPAGNFYGTTLWGGPAGSTSGGVVFQFIP